MGVVEEEAQSIFIILYKEGEVLKNRISRVCDVFSRERYELAEDNPEKEAEILKNMEEAKRLLQVTSEERVKTLRRMVELVEGSEISRLAFQQWYVAKEKSLYNSLSKLEVQSTLLRGLCWCPTDHVGEILQLIETENKTKGTTATFKIIAEHSVTPPSHVRVNEFNWTFQEVVSTYGTPSYQEANPAFFTVITFPFLFGVMFGDVCHGLILFCAGLIFCVFKDPIIKSRSMLAALVGIRYMVLFMGIFSIFCGFIYNEFAGLSMNIFPTCYKVYHEVDESLDVVREDHCVYQFGMDPFWKYSERDLQFNNSFKMKYSIIIGVIHMFIGVCLKLVNSIHFGKWVDGVFEFIPQAVFLLAMFGYMNVLIVMKWTSEYKDPRTAPVIITAIINMFIGFGKRDNILFDAQPTVNIVMVILIALCIPVMLIPKPFILQSQYTKRKKALEAKETLLVNRESTMSGDIRVGQEDELAFSNSTVVLSPKTEEFNFSEIFIHQLIETIEYALGTISNTASYLRLWALSLAHAELSSVFLEYAIIHTLEGKPSYTNAVIVRCCDRSSTWPTLSWPGLPSGYCWAWTCWSASCIRSDSTGSSSRTSSTRPKDTNSSPSPTPMTSKAYQSNERTNDSQCYYIFLYLRTSPFIH